MKFGIFKMLVSWKYQISYFCTMSFLYLFWTKGQTSAIQKLFWNNFFGGKKVHGYLQKGPNFNLGLSKLWKSKKKFELLKNIFFFNSSFSGASNDPPKYKIPEKNPVRHLEYASSPTYQKIINVVGEEHIELC